MNNILGKEFRNKFYEIMADFIFGYGFESLEIRIKTGKIIEEIQARLSRFDKGKISYLRNDKRMQLSVRRFLTRILYLNDHLSDVQLDNMADKILEICKISDYTFEYLTGSDIQTAYRNRIGGGSCMTGDCSEYMKMYADNPDRIKLAVVRYNNSSSRCIVWLGDDKKLYYDRIYANSSYCKETLKKELSNRDVIKIFEESVPVVVSDLNYTKGEIPYLDTLCYGTFCDDKLTLKSSSVPGPCDEVLQGQQGNNESEYICFYCECNVDEDDVYSVGDRIFCETCYYENYTGCENCGQTYHNDDLTYVQSDDISYCKNCLTKKCFACDTCDEIFHKDDQNCVDGDTLCETCYNDDYSECKACKEIIHKEDMENNDICKGCAIICSKCGVAADKNTADEGVCINCSGMFVKI